MASITTTRYYLNVFGSIQGKLSQTSGDKNKAVSTDQFEYTFTNDDEFFDHFKKLKVKTDGGKLMKGNTCVGVYDRNGAEHRDRPRYRINSEKFKEKKRYGD